jgi:hypothetical protein
MEKFAAILRDKIMVMNDMVVQTMTHSGFDSLEEYRYNLGYIHALNNVLAEMDTVIEDMRK